MNREDTLRFVLIFSLASLVVVITLVWILAWQHSLSMAEMMEEMMGGRMRMMWGIGMWWLAPTLIMLIVITLAAVVIYVMNIPGRTPTQGGQVRYVALTQDERRVVEYLERNGGQALQKEIARELGITRLKAHRLISSLRKRGVVEVEPWGNTNLVRLNKEEE